MNNKYILVVHGLVMFLVCQSLESAVAKPVDVGAVKVPQSIGKSLVDVEKQKLGPAAQVKKNEKLLDAISTKQGLEKIEQLVQEGADVNGDYKGIHMLNKAVENKDIKVVVFLLDNGANVNQADVNPLFTPLFYAVRNADFAMAKLLLRRGAKILNVLVGYAVKSKNLKKVEFLLDNGANVNQNQGGLTLLFTAVMFKDFAMAKLLLKRGVKVNVYRGRGGRTPLWWAIDRSDFEMVKLLLNHGADKNIGYHHWADFDERPMAHAKRMGNKAIINLLKSWKK